MRISISLKLYILLILFLFSKIYPQVNESQIKALIMLRMIQTVEWQTAEDSTIEIAVYKSKKIADEIRQLIHASKEFSRFRIIYLNKIPSRLNVHALFIGKAMVHELKPFLRKLQRQSILTFCDNKNIFKQGIAIFLVREGDYIKFDVNLSVLEKSKLKLSSRVLKLARTVYFK